MVASSALAQGGDPSTNNASLGQELLGPRAGFLSGLSRSGRLAQIEGNLCNVMTLLDARQAEVRKTADLNVFP